MSQNSVNYENENIKIQSTISMFLSKYKQQKKMWSKEFYRSQGKCGWKKNEYVGIFTLK